VQITNNYATFPTDLAAANTPVCPGHDGYSLHLSKRDLTRLIAACGTAAFEAEDIGAPEADVRAIVDLNIQLRNRLAHPPTPPPVHLTKAERDTLRDGLHELTRGDNPPTPLSAELTWRIRHLHQLLTGENQ